MVFRAPALVLLIVVPLALGACGDKKASAPTTQQETTGETTTTTPVAPPPVTTLDEIPPQPVGPSGEEAIAEYRAYLKKRSAVLAEQAAAFAAALRRGDPETAVKTYPDVRAAYERLQPIAVRLGLDADMNAREGAVPAADWRGFHFIEKTIFDTGMTGGTERPGALLAEDAATIEQSVASLEIDPAWILTDLNVALARAGTNMAAEEEPYSLENLTAASGNTKTAKAAWAALRPLVVASDKALAKEIDVAVHTAYITVESMFVPRVGYRRFDDIGPNDITAVVNAADAARAALVAAEQYLSN